MSRFIYLAAIIICLLTPLRSYGQAPANNQSKGLNYSFYPVFGYSSDIGFFGGGLFQRIDYADGFRPFLTNTLVDITGSTKGQWVASLEYEKTRAFGRPLRTRSEFKAFRNPISNYFGIGNETDFSDSDFSEGLYYLLKRRIVTRFEIRKPWRTISDQKKLEGVLLFKVSYTDNEDQGADTQFVQSPPTGASGGWVNTIGAGLIYDIRNSEFDPRSGIRAEAGADFSPVFAGNDFGFSYYFAEFTTYAPILKNTVFAQRFAAEHTIGSVPFFELPALGNEEGLRGYALNRFLGNSSVIYMAEMRTWVFSFLDDQIKLGGHLFFDTGRVFSDSDSSEFLKNWKQTWGMGGAMSLFNPDLILRGEVGISNESYRIYAGVGYTF